MDQNRGFHSLFYEGTECLGEMLLVPQEETDPSYIQHLFGSEIRVSYVSLSSERSLNPLAVLHTITPTGGPCFKMGPTDEQLLNRDCRRLDLLHSSCLDQAKTAVVLLENGNELHLVAMESRAGPRRRACFWAFLSTEGTYASCLGMLNLRCLAMVFDLDETLIVANTMRSFENRIEVLDRRVSGLTDMDPVRRASMVAELKRYQEDRVLLKSFVDNDQIFDENGNIIEAQGEVVPPLTEGALPLVRPIIRLPDRNMVLTRINPAVRDTSVLVRLRPAWEELRGYLIA
jgi:RNA polymerase II C-terminal domain phosphatase-like 1/2